MTHEIVEKIIYFSMGKYGFSVFVGNLSRRVRRDDLKDTFRDMGRIIEVDIKTGYGKFYGVQIW